MGFLLSFTGNIGISYGSYLPDLHKDSLTTQCDIDISNICQENKIESAYLTFSMRKLFRCEKQPFGESKNENCCCTLKWLEIFQNKNRTVEHLIAKIKCKKAHKKEYNSGLFDKTRYNVESGIQLDYEENDLYIQNIAVNITNQLENPSRKEIAEAVYKWVNANVDYEYPSYYQSKHYASQTAKLRMGNCCDQARLVIALCRAAGIPRYATEYYHSECVKLEDGKIVGHVWPVITTENGDKIICDTTCSGGSFGSPNWKNLGCIEHKIFLEF